MRYSKEGVLINRIGKSGDGPGEYPHIIDFTIDKGQSKIFILSAMSDVYIYSLDGTFEDKVNLSDDVICKVSCNPAGLMATSAYSSRMMKTNGFLLIPNFRRLGSLQFCELNKSNH